MINEGRVINIGTVNFQVHVDSDPISARFIAAKEEDLDKLSSEGAVEKVIKSIEERLKKATSVKWKYDNADSGAGYLFIPDSLALAQQIENSL